MVRQQMPVDDGQQQPDQPATNADGEVQQKPAPRAAAGRSLEVSSAS